MKSKLFALVFSSCIAFHNASLAMEEGNAPDSNEKKKKYAAIKKHFKEDAASCIEVYPFFCAYPDCKYARFTNKSRLKRHIKSEHLEKYKCLGCRQGFPTNDELFDHKDTCQPLQISLFYNAQKKTSSDGQ